MYGASLMGLNNMYLVILLKYSAVFLVILLVVVCNKY